jgi:hypothetical protein
MALSKSALVVCTSNQFGPLTYVNVSLNSFNKATFNFKSQYREKNNNKQRSTLKKILNGLNNKSPIYEKDNINIYNNAMFVCK